MGQRNNLKSKEDQRKVGKLGWFSRRHETDKENREAREKYQFNRGQEARQRRAQERQNASDKEPQPTQHPDDLEEIEVRKNVSQAE